MNEQPKEKTERNKQLYYDYKHGMSGVDMVAKYHITSTMIYRLIKNYEKKLGGEAK